MSGASSIRTAGRAPRQAQSARRVGYMVSLLINGAGFYLINVRPGWDAVPFLTGATQQVVGIVNTVLIATLAVNILYLLADPRWLVALGSLGTTVLGLIGLIRIWTVFPFDFGGSAVDWPLVFRIGLIVGIVGCCIAILVQLVQLTAALVRGNREGRPA